MHIFSVFQFCCSPYSCISDCFGNENQIPCHFEIGSHYPIQNCNALKNEIENEMGSMGYYGTKGLS